MDDYVDKPIDIEYRVDCSILHGLTLLEIRNHVAREFRGEFECDETKYRIIDRLFHALQLNDIHDVIPIVEFNDDGLYIDYKGRR